MIHSAPHTPTPHTQDQHPENQHAEVQHADVQHAKPSTTTDTPTPTPTGDAGQASQLEPSQLSLGPREAPGEVAGIHTGCQRRIAELSQRVGELTDHEAQQHREHPKTLAEIRARVVEKYDQGGKICYSGITHFLAEFDMAPLESAWNVGYNVTLTVTAPTVADAEHLARQTTEHLARQAEQATHTRHVIATHWDHVCTETAQEL